MVLQLCHTHLHVAKDKGMEQCIVNEKILALGGKIVRDQRDTEVKDIGQKKCDKIDGVQDS